MAEKKDYTLRVRMTGRDRDKLEQIRASHEQESLSATIRDLIRKHPRLPTIEEAEEQYKRAEVAAKALRIGLRQLIAEGNENARAYMEWDKQQAMKLREIHARESPDRPAAPLYLHLWLGVPDE